MAEVDPERFPICTDVVTLADGTTRECGQRHIQKLGNLPSCPDHVRKGAKNNPRQGLPCAQPISKGLKKCRYHQPANTRTNLARRAKAIEAKDKARTEARVVKMVRRWGVPVETTPMDAILDQIHLWAGLERFYRERVEELQDVPSSATRIYKRSIEKRSPLTWGVTKAKVGGEDYGLTYETAPNIWIQLHEKASDRLVKFCAEAIKCGIEERKIRLAESQGALVADAIRNILDALQLSPEQAAKVPEIVPAALRLIQGGAA